MKPNLEIETFLTFHNLQLEVIEKEDKLDLTPKSHRALMRFFERVRIADVKNAATYEKRLSEREKFQLKGTLGGYEFTHAVKWVESKDFQAFLNDYVQMWTLISNYLNRFYTRWDLNWLSNLRKTTMGNWVYSTVEKKKDFRRDGSEIYSHKDYNFFEYQTGSGSHILWHGLDLNWMARSIHDSLRLLVVEKGFELKRCALERCQKVFVISHTNSERHRFCSTSHRVMAHRESQENLR